MNQVKEADLFTPEQANLILTANRHAITHSAKKILRKVANKEPLTERERGQIEGILARPKIGKRRPENKNEEQCQYEVDFDTAARRRRVLELRYRHPPLKIREIAAAVGCNRNTVIADMQALREEFRGYLEADGREALGEIIANMDNLYILNMTLANAYTGPQARAAFIRNALACIEAKSNLMMDVGKIKKAPTRNWLSGPGDGPIPVSAEAEPDLTVEEKIKLLTDAKPVKEATVPETITLEPVKT